MKLATILPLLMLFVSSCATVSRPSIAPAEGTPTGNAFRLLLPAGTTLALPDERSAAQVRAIAADELTLSSLAATARTLTLEKPLQLVSPSYIAQRNRSEVELLRMVNELKEENARLRAR